MVEIQTINKIIERYNELRSPESHATLLEVRGNKILVKFDGFFCKTCGVNDWIVDLVYIAEDFGIKLKLEEIVELDLYAFENYRIGVFSIDE